MNRDPLTYRHPRSLREAFGHYAHGVVEAAGSPRGQALADRLIVGIGAVFLFALAVACVLKALMPGFSFPL